MPAVSTRGATWNGGNFGLDNVFDQRNQLVHVERLGKQLRTHRPVVGQVSIQYVGVGRKEDHWDIVRPHLLKDLDPINLWHLNIQDDELRRFATDTGKGFAPMLARDRAKPLVLQHITDHLDDGRLVVDHDNSRFFFVCHLGPFAGCGVVQQEERPQSTPGTQGNMGMSTLHQGAYCTQRADAGAHGDGLGGSPHAGKAWGPQGRERRDRLDFWFFQLNVSQKQAAQPRDLHGCYLDHAGVGVHLR